MRSLVVVLMLCAVLAGTIFLASRWRSGRKGAQAGNAGPVRKLRERILSSSPDEIGIIVPETPNGVWGLVMDMGVDDHGATLVALIDGNASLYIGERSGVIGGVAHEKVRRAAAAAVQAAEASAGSFRASGIQPMPPDGAIRFYALARHGLLASEPVAADALTTGEHRLSPLFTAANEVITQLRLSSEGEPSD